jgi:hypothetical protein
MGLPAGQRTFTSSTSTNASCTGTAWQDKQGSVRFTMLTGSVKLDSFVVGVNLLPDIIYADTVYPVPEPSTLALFGTGFLATLIWKVRKRAEGKSLHGL